MASSLASIIPNLNDILDLLGVVFILAAAYQTLFQKRSVAPMLSIAAICFLFGNIDKFSKFSLPGFSAELKAVVGSEVRQQFNNKLDVALSKIDSDSLKTVGAQDFTHLQGFCEPGYKATGVSIKSLSDQGTPVLVNLAATEKSGLQGYDVELQNGGGHGRPPSPLQLQVVCLGLKG